MEPEKDSEVGSALGADTVVSLLFGSVAFGWGVG